ncbi:hypothetical protein [Streptomyces alkaliterrae]|uniref:Uncharacterized protein n=1 Tax=Streptomyces alkaliterrae TaxID=2213162 RepID=A0A5P0YW93_9ACTN|nr:hypothetical protein [Streptomyces alkaliterrae]MBB1256068.1 hypothetical protein [Streptomyces alkaliterrae]MBB1262004.1 hypothetical protein [Streptomyces alkaliterrae]MQS04555.1 hypothetical protein [Streptomyces alkaliterrae]
MLATDPYTAHDPATLLVLLLLGVVTAPALAGYAISTLARARVIRAPAAALRSAAATAWSMAVALYTWGVLHLVLLDGRAQADACRAAVGERLTEYVPSFLPLRFGCRTGDGSTVEAVIPSYLNPALAVLAVCALVLTCLAIAESGEERKSTPAP